MHTIIFIHEYVHYTQPTQFIASNFAAIKPNAKLSFFLLISPVHPVSLYLSFPSSFNINYRALHVNRNHFRFENSQLPTSISLIDMRDR